MLQKEQKTKIFIITNMDCNLHCFSCSHGCNISNSNYRISVDEFDHIIKSLKENEVTVNGDSKFNFTLIGGEPLLHPQLKQLCQIANNYFPLATVTVSTNGLLLNKLSDKELTEYGNCLNLAFEIPMYPHPGLVKYYIRLKKRFEALHISHLLHLTTVRFYFSKQTILDSSQSIEDKDRAKEWFKECVNRVENQDFVIIYKNKIYNCWHNLTHSELISDQFFNEDYLSFDTIQPHQELLTTAEHQDCQHCLNSFGCGSEYILWHLNYEISQPYTNMTLKDIFLYHYNDYYTMIHDCKWHVQCLNDPLYLELLHNTNKDKREIQLIQTRFLSGAADIFIPYDNYIDYNFFIGLYKQLKIQQCSIYFIDYSKDTKIQKFIYEQANPADRIENDNFIFHLKAENLYNAYQVFLNNSYNKKKILFNPNDINSLLQDEHILENKL